MKVNQIVSEHKKGVRAMKYSKKTKGAVPVYGPKANDAKLKPVKPVGPGAKLDEAGIEIKPMPGAAQIQSDGKTIGTADAATANTIKQAVEKGALNLTNPNDPAAPNQGQSMEETNPNDVGGDPTDNFIADVTDQEFSQEQGREVDEAPEQSTYFVDTSSNPPSVKTTATARVPIKVNPKLDNPTPDVIARAQSQGFNQVLLNVNGKTVPGFLSGERCFVGQQVFQQLTANPVVKEDDALLAQMLTIAGLK